MQNHLLNPKSNSYSDWQIQGQGIYCIFNFNAQNCAGKHQPPMARVRNAAIGLYVVALCEYMS